MTLKQNLPTLVQLATVELAIAAAAFMKSQGWQVNNNLDAAFCVKQGITNTILSYSRPQVIGLDKHRKYVGLASTDARVGTPAASSMKEFIALLSEETLQIVYNGAPYPVEFRADAVVVGCARVPWETMRKIMEKDPARGGQAGVQAGVEVQLHNPQGLTLSAEHKRIGYRFLSKEEIIPQAKSNPLINGLFRWRNDRWDAPSKGDSPAYTYMTTLAPETIKAARR